MVDEGLGPTTLGKSFHSLWNAARSLETEVGMLAGRASAWLPSGLLARAGRALASAPLPFPFSAQSERSSEWTQKLEAMRAELDRIASQVAELRERERLLAGGVSNLGARAARFEKAVAALARVQGRYSARMGRAAGVAAKLESLATRRDEHITRVTRDLTVQRSQLERLSEKLSRIDRAVSPQQGEASVTRVLDDLRDRVGRIEADTTETRQLQKDGTQGTLHALELTRERLTRLEGRITEISREALAKTGRLDALSRHVASVEGRLARAIGSADEPSAPLARMDSHGAAI